MKKGLSSRTWLCILGGILVLSAAAAVWVYTRTPVGSTAVITLDGAEQARIDLSTVTEPYTLTYTGKTGVTDVVEVSPGKIRVKEATCPDQVCVRQGWIETGVAPIVCLPNRLVIKITGNSNHIDGIAG